MVTFSLFDDGINELKIKIQDLHEQLMYVTISVKDLADASQFISEKQREKKFLEAQLRDLENRQDITALKPPKETFTSLVQA